MSGLVGTCMKLSTTCIELNDLVSIFSYSFIRAHIMTALS